MYNLHNFKISVFEDGFDNLLVQALIEFEEQEEKKKENYLSKQELKNDYKNENNKRKQEDDKISKHEFKNENKKENKKQKKEDNKNKKN